MNRIISLTAFIFLLWNLSFAQKPVKSFNMQYVEISKADPRYFQLSGGETYIPVGANICWARSMEKMESYFKKLSENGGNFARIWLNHPAHEIETRFGELNELNLAHLDTIMVLAEKYNLKLKLCLESFREISPEKSFFSKDQYHITNGGPFENMEQYIQTEQGRKVFLKRASAFSELYGNSPLVFGWELWNEMNAVKSTGIREWNQYMLPRIHDIFPHNLVMQSLGSFDHDGARDMYRFISSLPQNDVAQIHRYLDLGAPLEICQAPMDVLASDAIDELRSYNISKPMLLAEVGGVKPRHTGPIEFYEQDKDGILLHDMLFAPFFSGAAGPGHAWHWDRYIDENNLWYHFALFNEAIKDVDPVAEKFKPVKLDHPKLRIYALAGEHTVLLWCRDVSNDWESEFIRNKPPRKIRNAKVDLSELLKDLPVAEVSSYDPWSNRWHKLKANPLVELPGFERSIVVKIARE